MAWSKTFLIPIFRARTTRTPNAELRTLNGKFEDRENEFPVFKSVWGLESWTAFDFEM